MTMRLASEVRPLTSASVGRRVLIDCQRDPDDGLTGELLACTDSTGLVAVRPGCARNLPASCLAVVPSIAELLCDGELVGVIGQGYLSEHTVYRLGGRLWAWWERRRLVSPAAAADVMEIAEAGKP